MAGESQPLSGKLIHYSNRNSKACTPLSIADELDPGVDLIGFVFSNLQQAFRTPFNPIDMGQKWKNIFHSVELARARFGGALIACRRTIVSS